MQNILSLICYICSFSPLLRVTIRSKAYVHIYIHYMFYKGCDGQTSNVTQTLVFSAKGDFILFRILIRLTGFKIVTRRHAPQIGCANH